MSSKVSISRKQIQAWIEQASASEIGALLLETDKIKALSVMAWLSSRAKAEGSHMIEDFAKRIEQDPLGSFVRGFKGVIDRK